MKKNPPQLKLHTSVQYIKGVGPKLGEILAKRGIKTVLDFLENYPRTYEDRRSGIKINQLQPDQLVSLKAQIFKIQAIPMGKTHRKIYDITLKDATGVIHCKFFRVPYKGYFERFKPFQDIRVVGKVIDYRGRLEFHHPDLRDIDAEEDLQDEIIPIYIEMEGVSSNKWQKVIETVLQEVFKDPEVAKFDKIPNSVLKKNNLIGFQQAILKIHQPPKSEFTEFLQSKSAAHKRLIFEEFFFLEVFLASKKMGVQKEKALPMSFM
jgi:ATP-dependent DNA helicase RecG